MYQLHYLERLSLNKEVAVLAKRINTQFYKENKTELKELQPAEYQAAYYTDEKGKVAALVCWNRSDETTLYLMVVWVHHKHRGKGLAGGLLKYVADYGKTHGYKRLYTDVMWNNEPMIRIMQKNWTQGLCAYQYYL